VELEPWIRSGFVSIRKNWTEESLQIREVFLRNAFKKAMTIKTALERECKLQAQKWGYDYFISLDIDEYVIPSHINRTIVDELHHWFTSTGRSIECMGKMNYQVTPHILEPVNLLTIEAYHNRMTQPAKMNYYMHVADKCAYNLKVDDLGVNASEFVATCCSFHGCNGYDYIIGDTTCSTHFKNLNYQLRGKGKPWAQTQRINHYSRSLEKFGLKSKTWRTASGEVKAGENSEQAARNYDLPKFFARNVGWTYDPVALRYSCQLREQLEIMTGEPTYLRPGDMWYRNVEFGRPVGDPDKRGRYGRQLPPGFIYADKNPYHYHGGPPLNVSIRNGKSIPSASSQITENFHPEKRRIHKRTPMKNEPSVDKPLHLRQNKEAAFASLAKSQSDSLMKTMA
jgi:hypothetical protein